MIQEEVPRWIFASVSKHFDTNVRVAKSLSMYIEGQHRETRNTEDFFELRLDGPVLTELSRNYWRIYFEVNVLIQAAMNESDFHKIHRYAGYVASAFTMISVYKYGDDDSLFACIPLLQDDRDRQRIQIFHLGQINKDIKVQQAVVEGHYQIDKHV